MATIKAIEAKSVHQIQSGQVIVDLCSVAKELVENSLDAGATSVEVRFKNHGLDSIEVQDNGSGIAPANYENVALKHYTSKLSSYDDLSSLRLELANVLFEGGDYRRAGPAYNQLAVDFAVRRGSDAEVVLRSRMQEATCHALVGETTQALRQLEDLLRDERQVYGEHDTRTLELRRQIGLLQLGAGQRRAAEKTLHQLEADLTRLHGAGHPAVTAVTDVLTGLHRSGHG